MANLERAASLSELHMIVLGRIAHHATADAEEIADCLGVSVAVPEVLCTDLEAAGLLTTVCEH